MKSHISLILLSTLQCNADCEYCFEDKTSDRLTLDRLGEMIRKVLDYMVEKSLGSLEIYWQGGEAMLLPPSWYEQANDLIRREAEARGKTVVHSLQSNMLAYSSRWNKVIADMFGNSVGTSLDYPNLHRKLLGHEPDTYNQIWARRVSEARAAGIEIQVIAVPNRATLELGAERFYSHFVDELGITDFQVNTPFPGGTGSTAKKALPVDEVAALGRFYTELADVWLARGRDCGVRVGPLDALLQHFGHQPATLPCIWSDNCANSLISIDARGYVAQCDCWVTSYPDYHYGNIFECDSLAKLLQTSPVRKQFNERPIQLIQRECLSCDYLSLCHGGCPVRTYTVHGSLFEKDPYCALYQQMFGHMEQAARKLARQASATPSLAA
ncbi:Radical SAM domain protein [Candidatus Competibacter denitrificans Run_A_D11]|uniref:Radical SAM domain protein n=1 Tax=Candidatus Competibacter denitrificans Run_A_D11 TaxID=1400863 RepID=W6MB26_9GAMM|nr:radical SAM protein [Candidatus Competibacter denitrificans]CDI03270.1 Radical SAM domain protein [Candidatus Competibacter denitrificans Run_A_D11]HAS87326.1 radical SAM protein [Candidatus Competibacteraceae bacterium]HRC69957.1 radical SAM protein [Candidatus Competibacter denitrificans]